MKTGAGFVIRVIFSKKEISPLPLSTGEKKKDFEQIEGNLNEQTARKPAKKSERKYRLGPWGKEQLRCPQREHSDLILYEPKCPYPNSDPIFLLLYMKIFRLCTEALC